MRSPENAVAVFHDWAGAGLVSHRTVRCPGEHATGGRNGYSRPMIKVGSIVLRVDDLARQTAFWTAALDYVPRDEESDDFVLLRPRDGVGPNVSLDRQRSTLQIPPRIHLDLYADDQAGEVKRLIALGATEVHWDKRPPDADYVILADPGRQPVLRDRCRPMIDARRRTSSAGVGVIGDRRGRGDGSRRLASRAVADGPEKPRSARRPSAAAAVNVVAASAHEGGTSLGNATNRAFSARPPRNLAPRSFSCDRTGPSLRLATRDVLPPSLHRAAIRHRDASDLSDGIDPYDVRSQRDGRVDARGATRRKIRRQQRHRREDA